MSDPRTLIETITRELVDEPEKVEVFEHPESGGVRIEIHVAQSDIGRVVGRQGRTVGALRTLLKTASEVDRTRYIVDVVG